MTGRIGGWISVTERLPEIPTGKIGSEPVLVAWGVNDKHICMSFYRTDGWVTFPTNEKWKMQEIITHWMPLPNPPKEAEAALVKEGEK